MIDQIKIFLEAIEPYIDTNDIKVIYDIGAGSSEETVELKNIFTNAEVYAFECNPACIHNCAKNIVNLDRITFIPICVFNSTGIIKFHPINQEKTITNREVHPDGNPRASSIYLANGEYPQETYIQDEITIPCMKIRDMINIFKLPEPELIWMDLQGAELPALEGMGNLSNVKIIHTEVYGKLAYIGQRYFYEIKKYVEQNNFVYISDFDDTNWFDDVNFIRKDVYDSAK